MKYLLLIVMFFLSSVYAEEPAKIGNDKIKIDGTGSDWSKIKPIMPEFGKSGKEAGFADVKSFYMAYTPNAFVFKAMVTPSVDSFSPSKEGEEILHVNIDLDSDDTTGIGETKYFKLKTSQYKGYEFRFVLLKSGSDVIGKLFSSEDKFATPVKEWKSGDDGFVAAGNIVEFKLPYDLLGLAVEGSEKMRFLFAEVGATDGTSGYMKRGYTMNFEKPRVTEKVESSSSGGMGFTIWHLILLTLWVVSILCSFAIAPKAGLGAGVAAINILPFLGQIIFLFILAFSEWPMHKDYNNLEERIKGYEEAGEEYEEY